MTMPVYATPLTPKVSGRPSSVAMNTSSSFPRAKPNNSSELMR